MANEFKVKNGLIVSGSADFEQDLRVRGTLTVDELHTSITTSSIIYESGSTRFGNSSDDIHTFTGSMNITGSISLNGDAIGTGKLDETTFNTYTSSYKVATADFNGLTGSYNSFTTSYISDSSSFNTRIGDLESFSSSLDTSFVNEVEFSNFSSSIKDFTSSINSHTSSTNLRLESIETATSSLNSFTSSITTTIKDKLNNDGVISGSVQILGSSNIVSSSAQVTAYGFAITGSNTFKGDQYLSGSIIPTIDNAFDLGSPSYQWRDVYISSGSLYIDNTKVLSSTAQELTITTDTGQSIKILEGGTDSIILQTADGDVELKSSGDGDILLDPTNGKIMLKGAVEILNGNKIQSSVGGTPVVFANDIVVSGSIDITGTIEGINLTDFSSSINTRVADLESSGGSLNSFTSSTIGRLNAIETTTSSLNTYTSSNNVRLNTIETSTGSLNSFTSSTNTRLSSIETTTGSIIGVNTTQNSRLDSLETTSGSLLSTNTAQTNRLDSIEGKTGSYATTGSNSFNGNQIVTGSLTITENLTVLGSSSLLIVTSSQLALSSSTISVNVFEPAERFGGLKVYDSGSQSHQATASLLWDSQNNHWIYQNASGSNYSGGMLLSGPRNTGSLGDELSLTNGKLPRSVGGDHLDNSIITQVGGDAIGISGSLTITGSILSSTTPLVSGSSQINHNTTTNYDANQHIDHTTVSISAGNGLSGGGTIAATRTISLDTASSTFTTGVKSKMNADGVVSGSSQITYSSISSIPNGIVSGSSQISYTGLSNIPSGIVSGSSQVSFTALSNVPSGIVSGSIQVDLTATTNYSSGIKTRLSAESVLSGSAQVVAALPAGTVSGSAQIVLSGTTGFSTYLNQAVLTTSSPSFAGLTSTGAISAGYSTTSEPFIQGHFYNTSTTTSTQYGGVLVSGINQAHIRFQVGTNSWGASGAKQWQIRVGNGAGEDNMKIYSWTYGADVLTISSNAAAVFAGNISAANLSGTNTGDQTNITGNAGTVTNGVYTNANNTLTGGNKIVIQNSTDGGTSRGIFMWNSTDPNWGIYMSQAGSSKTIAGTTAPSGIDARTEHAIRFRVASSTTQIGFLWENSDDAALMQLQPNTGNLYTRGQIYAGNSTSNLVLHTGNYSSYALPLNGGQLNGLVTMSDNAYFTGAPSHGFRWNSSNNAFNNVIMRDNGNLEVRGSLIAGSVGSAPQATLQVVGNMRWASGGNSYYTYSDMDGNGLYIETVDNNTGRAKMRFQTRVNNSGSYTSYQIDANNSQHVWVIGGSTRLTMNSGGDLLPGANGTQNIGSSSLRWNTVFTSDLSMSNGIGDYTIVEGEEDLFIYNNKTNKVFKFLLQEVDPAIAPAKKI